MRKAQEIVAAAHAELIVRRGCHSDIRDWAQAYGRVRIEAEASEIAGGVKLGRFTGEADGEDTTAVASHTVAEK